MNDIVDRRQVALARHIARACRVEPSFVDVDDPWGSLERELQKNDDHFKARYVRLRAGETSLGVVIVPVVVFLLAGTVLFWIEVGWTPTDERSTWLVTCVPIAILVGLALLRWRGRALTIAGATTTVAALASTLLFATWTQAYVVPHTCQHQEGVGSTTIETRCLGAGPALTPWARERVMAAGSLAAFWRGDIYDRARIWEADALAEIDRDMRIIYVSQGLTIALTLAFVTTLVARAHRYRGTP